MHWLMEITMYKKYSSYQDARPHKLVYRLAQRQVQKGITLTNAQPPPSPVHTILILVLKNNLNNTTKIQYL